MSPFQSAASRGDGRPRDLVRAYALFTVAKRHLEISLQYLDRTRPLLSTRGISAAQQINGSRRRITSLIRS